MELRWHKEQNKEREEKGRKGKKKKKKREITSLISERDLAYTNEPVPMFFTVNAVSVRG